jgi:hypothetical protein
VSFTSSRGELGAEFIAQQGIAGRKYTFESQLKLFRSGPQHGPHSGTQMIIGTYAVHPRPGFIDQPETQTAIANGETNSL